MALNHFEPKSPLNHSDACLFCIYPSHTHHIGFSLPAPFPPTHTSSSAIVLQANVTVVGRPPIHIAVADCYVLLLFLFDFLLRPPFPDSISHHRCRQVAVTGEHRESDEIRFSDHVNLGAPFSIFFFNSVW